MKPVYRVLAAVLLVLGCVAGFSRPTPARSVSAVQSVTIAPGVLDLHDGTVLKAGSTYYLYGTSYSCGFQWLQTNTPWCGFGVSTAPSLYGPWSTPKLLFSPQDTDPWTGTTWASECGSTGRGCFNPRMIIRSGWGPNDNVPILWFNSPADYYTHGGANGYNAMGCNSLVGPCGPSAGAPYGSYTKPSLHICAGNGDFTIAQVPGQNPAIICTMPSGSTLAVEQIDQWGVNGTGVGAANLAGLGHVEAPGAWQDPNSGTWVMTYSEPDCGYCAGAATGYATATSVYGPWTATANAGLNGPAGARRAISADSCGGQPRTVTVLDGIPWQVIDLWTGATNETTAGQHFEPLTYTPTNATGTTGDGGLHRGPLAAFQCL